MIRSSLRSLTVLLLGLSICVFMPLQFAEAQLSKAKLPLAGIAPGAGKIDAVSHKNWAEAEAYCLNFVADFPDVGKLNLKQYGPTSAKVGIVRRAAVRLGHLREPASLDYTLRAKHSSRIFTEQIINQLKASKQGTAIAKNAEDYYKKQTSRIGKDLARVSKLLADGKLDSAESELEEVLINADGFSDWLSSSSRERLSKQVSPVKRKVQAAMMAKRQTDTTAALDAAIKGNNPNADPLLAGTQKMIESIGATGKAKFGDKSLDGPAALTAIFKQFQLAHANLVRCAAIENLGKGLPLKNTAGSVVGTKLSSASFEEAVGKLDKQANVLLPQLITADLKRGQANNRKTYVEYVAAIGAMSGNSSLVGACTDALAVVDSQPGELADSIVNYKKATDDLLLWRKRTAQSAASTFKSVATPQTTDAFAERASFTPVVRKSVDQIDSKLAAEAKQLNQTYVDDVRMINAKAGFSAYQENTWATVIGEIDVTDQLERLSSDLLVSAEFPPLSVAAASSILSAKGMVFDSVGGTVSSAQVETVGPRFAKLPASMASFVPQGETPNNTGQLGQGVLRVTIAPVWVQHEHFFKQLQ